MSCFNNMKAQFLKEFAREKWLLEFEQPEMFGLPEVGVIYQENGI